MCDYRVERKFKPSDSPWGPDDQIGRLNWITDESRTAVMERIDPTRLYDLKVKFFMGMPSYTGSGEPTFQIWMIHTPRGNVIDDLLEGVPKHVKELHGFSAEVVSFFSHTGTHMDALSHIGYRGSIWNNFNQDEYLGSRHWEKCGVDNFPYIVGRGLLIDVATYKGVDMLPESYAISKEDIEGTLEMEGMEIQKGDILMIRTGRIQMWPDPGYGDLNPGLDLGAAAYITEKGAMICGLDSISADSSPAAEEGSLFPVHAYLLSEVGMPIVEVLDLEALAKDKVYEGAFCANVMPIVGSTGAPIMPVFYPFREE